MSNRDMVARSRAAVWHPCTQMKQHERYPLVPIQRAQGAWLHDFDGRRYLDGVSSWWVNLFGHAHPSINAAIARQVESLEHVMLAGFTHEPVVELAERLARIAPGKLGHAFFASDGASATEIALKMAFRYWANRGQPGKARFAALQGGYHGETVGALGVTDIAIFRDAYAPLLHAGLMTPFPARHADDHQYAGIRGAEIAAAALERLFDERHAEIAALIVEPLAQGAAGMRFYHPEYLRRARALCTRHDVLLIADEIMTGFGRTGTMFACEQAGIAPDLLCLSKGLTGGYLPLSCVLSTDAIYEAFYDDRVARGFLHSHSYTGNPLACRAACAVLDLFESGDVIATNERKAARFIQAAATLAHHPRVRDFRHLGMIWAFEVPGGGADFAARAFELALARGVLLRPIGNTVYFMPPYIVGDEEFALLVDTGLAIVEELGQKA
ncbi:MAG: adenosylmethionine--8-amino-7-oxononanoate transaminase [Pseudomonadota bacterium]|nr:adenosylmethionine--8-amino-7-oxononanoate transaminase [Pseudomonadota bacterium]